MTDAVGPPPLDALALEQIVPAPVVDGGDSQRRPPRWFTTALAEPAETGSVMSAGVEISYRAWGPVGNRGLLLVHGGAAHARWWDHLAPLIAPGQRVVALDLSGHGDSDRRPAYSLDLWADEMLAAAVAGGVGEHPVVIGHSMGGLVTLHAATRSDVRLGGVIIVDSAVRTGSEIEERLLQQSQFGRRRGAYPSRDAIVERFRLVPEQSQLSYVAAHIARFSVRQTSAGWIWKFDTNIFAALRPTLEDLRPVPCRTAIIRGEHGLVTPQMAESMGEVLGARTAVVEIPDAGHAIMVDQPLALLAAVSRLLASWNTARPAGQT